jgi:hypothetical protein
MVIEHMIPVTDSSVQHQDETIQAHTSHNGLLVVTLESYIRWYLMQLHFKKNAKLIFQLQPML